MNREIEVDGLVRPGPLKAAVASLIRKRRQHNGSLLDEAPSKWRKGLPGRNCGLVITKVLFFAHSSVSKFKILHDVVSS